eukprot:CAMPEP_0206592116 /NCGR_PEP_ID=MMETSP0325_2-20121206/40722_1 /ASSEMBLY_ACC=CAM_ASM_000347 /TAXON_ID=2866 /ORGANISM="Crypthecodinium cohnii, Strain Seligo" /LENGTH=69 /DNA_ID=CAMNT_0054101595 /DNA_START=1048 /DNA_END=1254 /DNA_ORIENTATION=-
MLEYAHQNWGSFEVPVKGRARHRLGIGADRKTASHGGTFYLLQLEPPSGAEGPPQVGVCLYDLEVLKYF